MVENKNITSGEEIHTGSHGELYKVIKRRSKHKTKRRSNQTAHKDGIMLNLSRHGKKANRKREHLKKHILLICYIVIGFILIAAVIAMLVNSFANLPVEKDAFGIIPILFVSFVLTIGAIVLIIYSIVKLRL